MTKRSFALAIGSDHAGFAYKRAIKERLVRDGHDVLDFGTDSEEACDYPDYVRPVAEAIASGKVERGIVLGGSGNGEAIVANRVPGVRCGLCWSREVAAWNRSHNDGNCLALGQRTVSLESAIEIVQVWLATDFEGGRHVARVAKIDLQPRALLHHLSFSVAQLERSAAFYDAVLAPLGHVRVWSNASAVGYGLSGGGDKFAIKVRSKAVVTPSAGFHLAFAAHAHAEVIAFHAAALAHGGRDDGAPGIRLHYGPSYYAAFVIDPDGYPIEVVFNPRPVTT